MRDFIDDCGDLPAENRVRSASDPVLEARGVTFETRGRRLVDAVDLEVRPGDRVAVMGPNGAGKSLLLRLLHGLIRPGAGQVLWQDRPLDRAGRRAQAMVFQRPILLRRSVRANLRFALAARGIAGKERAACEQDALAMARLEELSHCPARVLSGGEQQRLAIARALACRPDILFLDEPTASLDPASTHAVETLIGVAQARGVSTVLVTHDTGQAQRLGDHLVFLHAGRVAEAGSLRETLHAPRSEALRAWIDRRLYFEPAT